MSSCEVDLNNDGSTDIARLADTAEGRILIILMKTNEGFQKHVVTKNFEGMSLRCRLGKTVAASEATPEKNKEYETPGAYIELKQPEGASVAFFWNGSGFTEVWTAD